MATATAHAQPELNCGPPALLVHRLAHQGVNDSVTQGKCYRMSWHDLNR